jgi:hypothetical protein
MLQELGPYHEAQPHSSMEKGQHYGCAMSERSFPLIAPCHRRDMHNTSRQIEPIVSEILTEVNRNYSNISGI